MVIPLININKKYIRGVGNVPVLNAHIDTLPMLHIHSVL